LGQSLGAVIEKREDRFRLKKVKTGVVSMLMTFQNRSKKTPSNVKTAKRLGLDHESSA
jgi:hypothetical protein